MGRGTSSASWTMKVRGWTLKMHRVMIAHAGDFVRSTSAATGKTGGFRRESPGNFTLLPARGTGHKSVKKMCDFRCSSLKVPHKTACKGREEDGESGQIDRARH